MGDGKDRCDPNGVNPEIHEVRKPLHDHVEVADAVSVGAWNDRG